MTYFPVSSPFAVFTDIDGAPLEDGYIYIGEANQNPIVNPITIYWSNSDLYPAAQPVRTIGGFPSRSGSPANIYVNAGAFEDYSILVQNKKQEQIYYAKSARAMFDFIGGNSVDSISDLRTISGYNQPIYVRSHTTIGDSGQDFFEWFDGEPPGTYDDDNGLTVLPTGGDGSEAWKRNLKGIINAKDYGVIGDGVTNDTDASQAAITAAGKDYICFFPAGKYLIKEPLTLSIGSVIKGVTGGVVDLPSGYYQGTVFILSATTKSGSTWTTSETNPNGDIFNGRILFNASPAGGTLSMFDVVSVSENANAYDSTFLYCGSSVDNVPYENGRITQFHGSRIRVFAFNRFIYGARFSDAWLDDCATESVNIAFSTSVSSGSNSWSLRLSNCNLYATLGIIPSGQMNIRFFAANCEFRGTGSGNSFIESLVSGTYENIYHFTNCYFNLGRFFLRDTSSAGGKQSLIFDNSYFTDGSFDIVEEGTYRFDNVSFDNCTFNDFPVKSVIYNNLFKLSGCNFINNSPLDCKGGEAVIVSENNFAQSTATAPAFEIISGLNIQDLIVTNNIFRQVDDVGGSGYTVSIVRFKISSNSYVYNKTSDEYILLTSPGTGWTHTVGVAAPVYMKDESGFVTMRGRVNNSSPSADTVIGVLPSGFRPPINVWFLGPSANSVGECIIFYVGSNGDIIYKAEIGGSTSTQWDLSMVRFHAA